jgi:ABC-type Na+ efflux pump permease subunit
LVDPRLVVARRELRSLRAEKTIVLALLIQLFIAAFSSFLVVGLVSLYDPGSVEGYGMEVAVTGDGAAVEDLVAAADDVRGLDATAFGSADAAREAFDGGRVDAVLVAETRENRVFVTALVPDGDVRTTVVVVQLRDALRSFERTRRAERTAFLRRTPLSLPPRADASPYFGFTYTVLLPLLLFLPVFIGGSIAVDSITEEVERGTLELLRVAPVTPEGIVDGKALAAAGLAPVQALAWVALLEANGTRVANPGHLLVLVAALAVGAVALAAALGVLVAERRTAQLGYSLGILVLFGATTLGAGGPVSLAARLAIDSAGRGATTAVALYAGGAVALYAGLRALVGRVGLE